MLRFLLNAIKDAILFVLRVIMFPFAIAGSMFFPARVPPPPPAPDLGDLREPALADDARRWSREIKTWARLRLQNRPYEPKVPCEVNEWLTGLHDRAIQSLAAMSVQDIWRHLRGDSTGLQSRHASSSSADSASTRAASARRARALQYSATSTQDHSVR
jgi:hypothetical protein